MHKTSLTYSARPDGRWESRSYDVLMPLQGDPDHISSAISSLPSPSDDIVFSCYRDYRAAQLQNETRSDFCVADVSNRTLSDLFWKYLDLVLDFNLWTGFRQMST